MCAYIHASTSAHIIHIYIQKWINKPENCLPIYLTDINENKKRANVPMRGSLFILKHRCRKTKILLSDSDKVRRKDTLT